VLTSVLAGLETVLAIHLSNMAKMALLLDNNVIDRRLRSEVDNRNTVSLQTSLEEIAVIEDMDHCSAAQRAGPRYWRSVRRKTSNRNLSFGSRT
jgi:hypothetical protein